MTLEKATEILTAFIEGQKTAHWIDRHDAIKLGIEALKAIQLWRKEPVLGQPTHLPGETKK